MRVWVFVVMAVVERARACSVWVGERVGGAVSTYEYRWHAVGKQHSPRNEQCVGFDESGRNAAILAEGVNHPN